MVQANCCKRLHHHSVIMQLSQNRFR
uniref:Uncharacterized protein n=1 Tax=Anguilla anguilla TaxID=7936 RepID=A0A0E9VDF3_ANGAN